MSASIDLQPIRLPIASVSDRKIVAGRGKCVGATVFDDGEGCERVVLAESAEEMTCHLCLAAAPDTRSMREQVRIVWEDAEGRTRTHYLDLVVLQRDGRRVGYSIKPAAKIDEAFLREMAEVGAHAVATNVVDDLRVLSAADFDPVTQWNARFLHAVREPDAEADLPAREAVRGLDGTSTLGALADRIGMQGRGFRALVRLVRSGVLGLSDHVRLTHAAAVFLQEDLR